MWCFCGRAVLGMDANHVFTHVSLIKGVIAVQVLVPRACPRCWVGPSLCSVAVTAVLGMESPPQLLD